MKAQKKYKSKGVQIAGIGIDSTSKILDYASEMKIDYALFIGGVSAFDLTRDLGNRDGVLPFTVVLDRLGNVAFAHAGAMTEVTLDGVLSPLI